MEFRYKGQTMGGVAGGSAGEVYSTQETRIGTWIDGKPVYRKIINGLTGSVNTWKEIGRAENVETPISMYGILIDSTDVNVALPYALCPLATNLNYSGKGVLFSNAQDSYYTNRPIMVIFEYTKTTDEPKTIELSPAERSVFAAAKAAQYVIPEVTVTATATTAENK